MNPNRAKRFNFRTVWISDVHLGTADSKVDELLFFLDNMNCENLFLVGDIIDFEYMGQSKKGQWNTKHTQVIGKIASLSKAGINVYYILGNHDSILNGSIQTLKLWFNVHNRFEYHTKSQKRILVCHGDEFEPVHAKKLLKKIGSLGYKLLLCLDRVTNFFRAIVKLPYWSPCNALKNKLSSVKKYISDYEKAVIVGAKREGFDGVICGHIHSANRIYEEGFVYLNCGDWVEECSAVVEQKNGQLKIIKLSEIKTSIHEEILFA